MAQANRDVQVFINKDRYTFEEREHSGATLKSRAGIPLDHVLYLGGPEPKERCACDGTHVERDVRVIGNDEVVVLANGQHFWSVAAATCSVTVTINREKYTFAEPQQIGRALKERAGIALTDVLFRDRPQDDEVIGNETTITLHCKDMFHSAPPANYGAPKLDTASVGFEDFEVVPQPDGWTFLVVNAYPVPEGYTPNAVRLLVKLPPAFPDAAPDMFWLEPHIRTSSGASPQGTSNENVLGKSWQRFSWHLLPGAWRPGSSTLRDYLRCVRARFEKRN